MSWTEAPSPDEYRNPIIWEDYSDPDVIRSGGDYWMTASSFNYLPGLPILHSRDLVNWTLVNSAVRRLPSPSYDRVAHGCGIWAPSLRRYDGRFWIFYGMPDEGIFAVHADDPRGEWSEPRCVIEARGFIDPCPLWMDDGRAFVIHAYAKSRIGFKSRLGIFEFDPAAVKARGADRIIYDGEATQPTIEGPKLYVRDGRYYIFAPAGGVAAGWQTVLRGDSPDGPFEERIVMDQGPTPVNGPHQGGLVDSPDGLQWFIHFQDRGPWGRITHLQPVTWEDGWPLIGSAGAVPGRGNPVARWNRPPSSPEPDPAVPGAAGNQSAAADTIRDDFTDPVLSHYWQWPANPVPGRFRTGTGRLRLYCAASGGDDVLPADGGRSAGERSSARNGAERGTGPDLDSGTGSDLWSCPALLTRRVTGPSFTASVRLFPTGLSAGSRGGLAVMGREYGFIEIAGGTDGKPPFLRVGRGSVRSRPGAVVSGGGTRGGESEVSEDILTELPLDISVGSASGGDAGIELRADWDEHAEYRLRAVGADGRLLAESPSMTAVPGVWVGARLALYARRPAAAGGQSGDSGTGCRFAEFADFTIRRQQRFASPEGNRNT